jgi:hypothetical protein
VPGQRQRPILIAAMILVAAWVAAIAGYTIAKNSRMSAARVRAYAESMDLKKLTRDERAKAIRGLAERLNRLSPEERRKARFERISEQWFEEMTEDEKAIFVELTMPTGFKQMLASFEQLPEDKRRKSIDDAMRRLKEAQAQMKEDGEAAPEAGTNTPPALSRELQDKIAKIGLKTFYSESSAQTKAEMAPMLEELQRTMESGRMFRGGR